MYKGYEMFDIGELKGKTVLFWDEVVEVEVEERFWKHCFEDRLLLLLMLK